MAIPTGLAGQLMVGEEVTHGTAVTPTRGYEFVSESMKLDIARLESQGIRAGTRIRRSDRWAAGRKTVSGSIAMELANKSFGLWLKHMFGAIAITTPGGGTLTRDHTATPGDLPAGLTVQFGRPDETGTVQPFTYEGCVVTDWELTAETGQISTLSVDLSAEDETTVTGLATASYPAGLTLLTYVGATLDIAGAEVPVKKATVKGSNGLNTDRTRLGSQLRRIPVEGTWREYSGEVEAYFASLAAYNRFVNGTEAALVLEWVGANIETTLNYGLTITANVRFDGETPTVGGPDEIMQPLPFVCRDTGSGPGTAISVVYRTTDTVS